MGLLNKIPVRQHASVILNVVKDGGWCYACGIVSIIAFIPVLSFEAYEIWKSRKEGWNQITSRLTGMVALVANASWMLNDTVFNGKYHAVSKWLFGLAFLCLIAYSFSSYRQAKRATSDRLMTVSKETRGIVFVHSRLAGRSLHHHRMVVPRRLRKGNVS